MTWDFSVAAANAVAARNIDEARGDIPTWLFSIALVGGVWYFFILVVQIIGFTQLYRHYSSKPKAAVSPTLQPDDVPHITIIRPVKGLEPQLYECLASTLQQSYPSSKLTVYFCVSSVDDPSYPVLQRLLADFPQFDVKLFVEDEDPNLSGDGKSSNLGPNPKIRNMSRGYREAKGDLIWVIDCNIWVGKGVAGRMVDKLCGLRPNGQRTQPYKFVHLLPLVVDSVGVSRNAESRGLLETEEAATHTTSNSSIDTILRTGGGRLEEMFMASSHAKFYTAINTVSVAPCIVGKSNMFRKSHLDALTNRDSPYSPGIDFFSEYICEDHIIGDLLWRKKVPGHEDEGWKNHGLVFGDLAIQPMANTSISSYIARRVRWLRVRKWTVMLATFVEPGVEPLLCSAYGAFALTTLPYFPSIPSTWSAFFLCWLISIFCWQTLDYICYRKLHSGASVELDADTPSFARPLTKSQSSRRPLGEWLLAWWGRELLALPIWCWAVYGGATIMWRGKRFRVGMDMKAREIKEDVERAKAVREAEDGTGGGSRGSSKSRQD
ncbi:ceramide glucosyltransferase [Coleophoma cylindrospora]|uniref:Ceramide glucosyltransferase n=1 Tax=Coleophoma cylindrospora TaxID=1849047 RepID=A0A3D8SEJ2_9HELO|nr:ceramide glucosyltransferase [Coleophoma cylindrospora]